MVAGRVAPGRCGEIARRSCQPAVLHGKDMFYRSGCTACHTPKFVTRDDLKGSDGKVSPQAFQLIWPYSDFLLHDMGEGLSDGQQVGVASGRDWRTPPLWGIGLTQTVSGRQAYLQDGRARTLKGPFGIQSCGTRRRNHADQPFSG